MKKSLPKLIAFLENYNAWRRGSYLYEQPVPEELGQCLDQAVEMLKKMTWQPMETAPQDHLFVGIYGPIDPPLWKEYSFFYAIGDGLYKCREISSVTFPSEHCKIFGWVEIPKYEGWSGTQWQLRPETPSSSDHEYQVKTAIDMLTSLEKRLQKP